MIHRGELYYCNPDRKIIFVVYGTPKYVTDALYSAYMHNKALGIYRHMGFSNLNILKYGFEKIKGLFKRDKEEMDISAIEAREELRENRRKRLQSQRNGHITVG